MKLVVIVAVVAVSGCGQDNSPTVANGAGPGLERAATAAGLVTAVDDPTGLYASETDRLCLVARGGNGYRVAATVDYGPEHRCSAAGSATGRTTLQVRLSDDCRFTARFEGDRVLFPAVLPSACDRVCTGRASLAALEADRLSASPAEAATMTDLRGGEPCAT